MHYSKEMVSIIYPDDEVFHNEQKSYSMVNLSTIADHNFLTVPLETDKRRTFSAITVCGGKLDISDFISVTSERTLYEEFYERELQECGRIVGRKNVYGANEFERLFNNKVRNLLIMYLYKTRIN